MRQARKSESNRHLNLGNSGANGISGTYEALSGALGSLWSGQKLLMFLRLFPRNQEYRSGSDVPLGRGLAPLVGTVNRLERCAIVRRQNTESAKLATCRLRYQKSRIYEVIIVGRSITGSPRPVRYCVLYEPAGSRRKRQLPCLCSAP